MNAAKYLRGAVIGILVYDIYATIVLDAGMSVGVFVLFVVIYWLLYLLERS